MALQPKSTNLPEVNEEAVPNKTAAGMANVQSNQLPMSAAAGSENTPIRTAFENL